MSSSLKRPVRLGFIPVSDCAPLVIAKEFGIFESFGVSVELVREKSWETLRQKFVHDELDAVHALAPFPLSLSVGLNGVHKESVTGLVLSLQGNAITLSKTLMEEGVDDGATLRAFIQKSRGKRKFSFGIPHLHSCQHFLLLDWLQRNQIHVERDIRLLEISPDEMFPHLRLGYLDGFCVGEPWTSVTVLAGAGCCATTSAELAPNHPEKVFMVSRKFAEDHSDVHLRLIAALIQACGFCEQPENRIELCRRLSQPHYVNAPLDSLKPALIGPFRFLPKEYKAFLRFNMAYHDLSVFYKNHANEPTSTKGHWVLNRLSEVCGFKLGGAHAVQLIESVFRLDLFDEALSLFSKSKTKSAL